MKLGNRILMLRKNLGLSQEQLAEQINVTRQTISNWELEQTTPDIIQAKQLSEFFNISLDELVENDIKDILVKKITYTEKSIGKITKVLKLFAITLICFIIIFIIVSIASFININKKEVSEAILPNLTIEKFYCTLDNQKYGYQISYDENYKLWSPAVWHISGNTENIDLDFIDISKYDDAKQLITDIKTYFEDNGGTWEKIK